MSEAREAYQAGAAAWDATRLRALRRHLGLTQQELANELGVRQQTVSEWETGMYRPRGASRRLLGIVAERAGFRYQAGGEATGPEPEP
jgi:DNA-binding transcriptional regulator YiaG